MLKRKADDVTLCASSVAHFEDIHRVSARSAEVRNLEYGRVAWETPALVTGLQMQEQGFDRRPSTHAKTGSTSPWRQVTNHKYRRRTSSEQYR